MSDQSESLETPLYMRVRGRVLGPYEPEKLQAMVRRGQLSRLHELSTDGVSWVRASNFPELFATNVELPTTQHSTSSSVGSASTSDATVSASNANPAAESAVAASAKWYFSRGGAQGGPVDLPALRRCRPMVN